MKKYLKLLAIAFVILSHPVSSLASQGGRQVNQEVSDVVSYDLSATEIEYLTFMREEEKLARDVYLDFSSFMYTTDSRGTTNNRRRYC